MTTAQQKKQKSKTSHGLKETISLPKEAFEQGEIKRKWHIVDASVLPLGRLCSKIALILRGKHQPYYTPHVDCGDYVVVVNAKNLVLTGNKLKDKIYYHHTGFVGGIKEQSAQAMLNKKPENLVYLAVKRMMPRSPMNRHALHKLKIYAGKEHPHQANQLSPLSVDQLEHFQPAVQSKKK